MSSLKLFRLWAALLLGMIGLQATMSPAPTAERKSGSAFSAATFEVALYVQRGERVKRLAVAPQPIGPPALSLSFERAPAPVLFEQAAARPDSTGPPLHDIHSGDPAPRAPPRA